MNNQKMSYDTNEQEIMPQSAMSEAGKTDNPMEPQRVINQLYWNAEKQRRITAKYRLNDNGYYHLMLIVVKWVNNREASSVYSLARLPKNSTVTAVANVIGRLVKKGLVEVVGYGWRGCRVYAPTAEAIRVLVSLEE